MAIGRATAEEPGDLVTLDELLDPSAELDPWKPGAFSVDDLTRDLLRPRKTDIICDLGPLMPTPPTPTVRQPSPWPAIGSYSLLLTFWALVFVRRRQVSLRSIMALILGVAALSAIFADPLRALLAT
jgi:hypothetical protein